MHQDLKVAPFQRKYEPAWWQISCWVPGQITNCIFYCLLLLLYWPKKRPYKDTARCGFSNMPFVLKNLRGKKCESEPTCLVPGPWRPLSHPLPCRPRPRCNTCWLCSPWFGRCGSWWYTRTGPPRSTLPTHKKAQVNQGITIKHYRGGIPNP